MFQSNIFHILSVAFVLGSIVILGNLPMQKCPRDTLSCEFALETCCKYSCWGCVHANTGECVKPVLMTGISANQHIVILLFTYIIGIVFYLASKN